MSQGIGESKTTGDSTPRRTGKWTPEEEEYVECLIAEFKAGYLPLEEGKTLRSFLSNMLMCKPKRVSKKYEKVPGFSGKLAFTKNPKKISSEEIRRRRDKLSELERKFHDSLEAMERVETRLQTVSQGRGRNRDITDFNVSHDQLRTAGMPGDTLLSDLAAENPGRQFSYGDRTGNDPSSAIARLNQAFYEPHQSGGQAYGHAGGMPLVGGNVDPYSSLAVQLRQRRLSNLVPPPNYQGGVGSAASSFGPMLSDMLQSQAPGAAASYGYGTGAFGGSHQTQTSTAQAFLAQQDAAREREAMFDQLLASQQQVAAASRHNTRDFAMASLPGQNVAATQQQQHDSEYSEYSPPQLHLLKRSRDQESGGDGGEQEEEERETKMPAKKRRGDP